MFFFQRINERLFGNNINQAYEATIFVVAMNVIIAFYTLSFLMNILNIPDLYKYELFKFSASKIEIGNLEIAIKEIEIFKNRMESQLKPDGSQPLELARTKSWGYVNMNMFG